MYGDADMLEALYWEPADKGAVRCMLCPHRCMIADGITGICGTRKNTGGRLMASGYGVVSSIALDPIEKKPLYMFHPGKRVLSIGGYGCNLKCPFCQNYEISMVRTGSKIKHRYTPEEIVELAVKTVEDNNIGVAYTYNEPLIGYEFLTDCAALVKNEGLKNVVVTNGNICEEPLEAMLPLIDAMNIDLKGFTEEFYKRVGGSLETVKKTIQQAQKQCHVEVTTLVIPGENESDVEDITKWLSAISPEIPLHLSRFFPRYKYSEMEPTPRETIYKLCNVAGKYLKNVFAGNV